MRYDDYDDYEELERPRRKRSESTASRTGKVKTRSTASQETSARSTKTRSTSSHSTTRSAATSTSHSTAADSTATRTRRTRSVDPDTVVEQMATKKSTRKATSYDGYSEEELLTAERKRQKRAEKQKKAKKKRRRLIAMLVVEAILLVAIVAFIWVISKYDTIQKPNWGKQEVPKNTAMDEEVVEHMKTGFTDIMVFGVDGGSQLDGGSGSDVNMLIHIDNATGEIKLVSFYRDLYLNTGGNNFKKLTDIYRADGAQAALGALNMNLDLQLDMFVAVNWATVAETINLLGGIDIDVPQVMLSQINGYITDTVNTTGIGSVQLKNSGYQHLDGIQTVAFCRIRKLNVPGYSMGDYGRTERQRQVIGLLLQKVKKSDLGTINGVIDYVLPNTFTNVELKDVLALAADVFSYSIGDTAGFPFNQTSSDIGNSIVYSQDLVADIDQLHTYLYGEETDYTVSEYAQDIADKLYSIPGID